MTDRLTSKERLKNKTDIFYFSFSKGQVHCKDTREMRESKKKAKSLVYVNIIMKNTPKRHRMLITKNRVCSVCQLLSSSYLTFISMHIKSMNHYSLYSLSDSFILFFLLSLSCALFFFSFAYVSQMNVF